jgi:RNA polymerase sigma factor (TIGR02999 family)
MSEQGDITINLKKWVAGSKEAEDHLYEIVFPKLRELARAIMSRERRGHTVQATELVAETYFRMSVAKNLDWQNRQHFFAIAARCMRRFLIDYHRKRHAENFVPIQEIEQFLTRPGQDDPDLVIDVARWLEELQKTEPDWCKVVELKFFLGFTDQEAAEAMGISSRTMQRMWAEARQWLFKRIRADKDGAHQSVGG